MARNYHIPNPLTAMDDVWKKAAGPTQRVPRVPSNQGAPIQIAGTKPRKLRKRKSNIPEGKI